MHTVGINYHFPLLHLQAVPPASHSSSVPLQDVAPNVYLSVHQSHPSPFLSPFVSISFHQAFLVSQIT